MSRENKILGKLIVFEGTTSSGKTLHARQLYEFFKRRGRKVILNGEPTKGFWGKVIRTVIESPTRLLSELERQRLFVLDRLDDLENTISPMLRNGYIILQDRYELSTYALGMANGLKFEEASDLHKSILGDKYRRPDIVFFLDVKPNVAIERLKKSGKKIDIYENLKFTKRVHENYKKLVRMERFGKKIIVINANKTIQEAYDSIVKELRLLHIIE